MRMTISRLASTGCVLSLLLTGCTWNTHHIQPSMRDALASTSKATSDNSEGLAVYVNKLPGFTYSMSESGSDVKGSLPDLPFHRIGQISIASRDARNLTIEYFAQEGYCQSDGLPLAPLGRAMNTAFAKVPHDLIPSGHIRVDIVAPGHGYAITTHAIKPGEWIEMRFIKPCGYANTNYNLIAITATMSHEISHAMTYIQDATKDDTLESEDVADDAPACFFMALGSDSEVALFKGYSHEEWYYNSMYHLGQKNEQPLQAMCRTWVAAMNALPHR